MNAATDALSKLRSDIERRKLLRPVEALAALHAPEVRDFVAAVRNGGLSIIAEVRRRGTQPGGAATPTGTAVNPARAIHALAYGSVEAADSVSDLESLRRSIAIPLLRSEPVIDAYQLYESRVAGADAVLLPAIALGRETLRDFVSLAQSLGLTAVVLARRSIEIAAALDAGAEVLALDGRDPATGRPSMRRAVQLRGETPAGRLTIAANAASFREDLDVLEKVGYDAAIVGESLNRDVRARSAVRELTAVAV